MLLISVASELDLADTQEKMAYWLREQHRIWCNFHQNTCHVCHGNAGIEKLAKFVLWMLEDKNLPNDLCISALVGLNLRASALLGALCPERGRLKCEENLAYENANICAPSTPQDYREQGGRAGDG
jgi:hypothetical protein